MDPGKNDAIEGIQSYTNRGHENHAQKAAQKPMHKKGVTQIMHKNYAKK